MRSNKHYSNVAFTKRVDYPAGAHRPARAAKEPLVCTRCKAVYAKRRWILASDSHAAELTAIARPTLCPACDMEAKHLVRGYLRLEGAFVKKHRAELERLVMREAGRAAEDNPLGRIIRWEKTPGTLTVLTTTEHLAARLGHAVNSAYDGTVEYTFAHGEKFGRTFWRRD